MIRNTLATLEILSALSVCAYETGIQRYSESKSKFNPPTQVTSNNIPEKDVYRTFQQGATGFVPISSIRENLEERAAKFCERQGKGMLLLGQNNSKPPYILGNFLRVEILSAPIEKRLDNAESLAVHFS